MIALQAIKLGAYDYLVKPVERDRLVASMRNAVERYALQAKVEELEAAVQERYENSRTSSALRSRWNSLCRYHKVAPSSISVYVHGESGTSPRPAPSWPGWRPRPPPRSRSRAAGRPRVAPTRRWLPGAPPPPRPPPRVCPPRPPGACAPRAYEAIAGAPVR